MLVLALTASLPLLSASDLDEDRWPGWRGPGGAGVAAGSPPIEWSEEKNVRWKAPVPGKGSSGPVVWGDRVFLTTAVPTEEAAAPPEEPEDGGGRRGRFGGGRTAPIVEQEFVVLAFDRADGSVAWRRTASTRTPHQGTHRDGSYASATLVTDGELVIASFGSFGVYAYTFDGEPVWEKDLGDMEITRSFGEGSSPLLHGDTLILNWDHEGDSFIVALDKKTGEERWRRARSSGTTWSTPVLVDGADGPLVVIGAAKTIAYRVDDGTEVWSYDSAAKSTAAAGSPDEPEESDPPRRPWPGTSGRRGGRSEGGSGVITTPVVHDGVLVYSTGSRRGSFRALRLEGASGELTDEKALLWRSDGDTPHIPSPIAYEGIFYSLKSNAGLLSAFDVKSGERLYGPQRLAALANAYASPVAADGHLFFTGRDGTVEVVAAGPEFKSIAVNHLDEEMDASPAIAGDELFLRGRAVLYCIGRTE